MIALLAASIMILPHISAQTEETVIVKVVNPLGQALKGVEVLLTGKNETRRFVTNASGYAEFKYVSSGEYVVKAVLNGVVLAEENIMVPQQREITLTAKIASVKFSLTNMDGEPLGGLSVILSGGNLFFKSESDKNGVAFFDQVPYSELRDVGTYSLSIYMGDLTIYRGDLRVATPNISKNISLPLLNIKIAIKDLEGDPVPKVSLTASSPKYSIRKYSDNGTILVTNLPSSVIEGIGAYRVNVTMRTEAGDILIHSENRMFVISESIDLVADLAKLRIKILDDEEKPLSSIKLILSNELAENFASAVTDKSGVAVFERIPLSFGEVRAGKYVIKAFRGEVLIKEMFFEVLKPRDDLILVMERKNLTIRLTDFNGEPLANYHIKLIDELVKEEIESMTDFTGSASFKLLPGPYEIHVLKDGKEIYSGSLDTRRELVDLNLAQINFPLKIIIRDIMGNPVKSAMVRISAEMTVLREVKMIDGPIEVILPYPTYLSCDIYSPDGRLLQRSRILADGPGVKEVILRNYVEFNGLWSLESIALVIASAIAVASILSIYAAIRVRRKTKG